MNFRTFYVVAIVLTLLFGIGLGYQIHTLVGDDSENEARQNQQTDSEGLYPSVRSSKPVTEVFVRTGKIISIEGSSVDFSSYVQNTDSSFTKSTLTTLINDQTSFIRIHLAGNSEQTETISLQDLKVGDDIAVQSDTNVYGKTQFTASAIQLQAN